MVQLINAARSVSFDPLPTQSVEKGDNLSIVVQARSSLAQKIGGLDCALLLSGKNNPAPPHNALVDADNAIRFEIRTGQLETGTYNVSLELFLHKAASHIARNQNPMMGFSFEITPAAGSIVFEGDSLSDAEQRDLIQAVQQAIQNHRVPLQKGVIFTVTLSSRKSAEPISGTEIILCDVSLNLMLSGALGVSSGTKRITEFSQNDVIRLAGNFIRDNATFWQSVNGYLSR
jgi:hypothetical protein